MYAMAFLGSYDINTFLSFFLQLLLSIKIWNVQYLNSWSRNQSTF